MRPLMAAGPIERQLKFSTQSGSKVWPLASVGRAIKAQGAIAQRTSRIKERMRYSLCVGKPDKSMLADNGPAPKGLRAGLGQSGES